MRLTENYKFGKTHLVWKVLFAVIFIPGNLFLRITGKILKKFRARVFFVCFLLNCAAPSKMRTM